MDLESEINFKKNDRLEVNDKTHSTHNTHHIFSIQSY